MSTFKSVIIALTMILALVVSMAAAEGKITPRKGTQSQKEEQAPAVGRQPWDGDIPDGDYATRCQRQKPGRLPDGRISKPLHDLWLAPGRGLGAGQGGCSNLALPISNVPGGFVSFGRCGADNLTAGIWMPARGDAPAYAVMVQGSQGVAFTSKALLDATLEGATSRYDVGPGQMFAITTSAGSYLFVRPLTNGGAIPLRQRTPHGACDPSSTRQYPYTILAPAAARLLVEYINTHSWVWAIDDTPPGTSPGLSFTLRQGAVSGPVVGHLWCIETTCTLDAGQWHKTSSGRLSVTNEQLAVFAKSAH